VSDDGGLVNLGNERPQSKYARIERERRWLARELPGDLPARYERIDDLYLAGTRLRLRRVSDPDGVVIQRKLGQKELIPGSPATHTRITTLYLSAAEYALFEKLPGARLSKRRHRYPHAGRLYAIDVFAGALAGLILVECDAGTDDELEALSAPPLAARDVTDLAALRGGALAEDPARGLAEARRILAG
jgi:hypothetical protein